MKPSPLLRKAGREGTEVDGGDTEHRDAFLLEHGLRAIEIIEKEVHRRRRGAENKVIESLTLQETGLWSRHPDECWSLETRVIEKQEYAFRLIAPDEPDARSKLIAQTPRKASDRAQLIQNRAGSTMLF